MRCHPCFDANETGWHIRKPRCDAPARDLLSQHNGAARIKAHHVKCGLAHIYSDGGHWMNVDLRGMMVLLFLTSPPHALWEPLGAGARPVHPIRYTSRWFGFVVASDIQVVAHANLGTRFSDVAESRNWLLAIGAGEQPRSQCSSMVRAAALITD